MNFYAFAQPHLDRVSRSFAFCIARLEGPLQSWVALSYLLCRILDTIEDAPWSSLEDQQKSFQDFHLFVHQNFDGQLHSHWISQFPKNIPEGERLLIENSFPIFQEIQHTSPRVQKELRRTLFNMERGMRFFMDQKRTKGVLRLKSLKEVNQYCFFVAGIVGELLTELLNEARRENGPAKMSTKAHHFGLFLQKINLLKDQHGDENEGRYLVPERSEVVASLAHNAIEAFSYLEQIPVAEKGFRLFCAWSLFLGLASLPWISRTSSRLGIFTKIPRSVTNTLCQSVERVIDDGQALRELFTQSMKSLAPMAESQFRISGEIPNWFLLAYEGPLKPSDLHDLDL